MADQQEWPTERLRALDRAVAEARGWSCGMWVKGEFGYAQEVWLNPDGARQALPPVSKDCAETFELMEELEDRASIVPIDGRRWQIGVKDAPTIPIAVCLYFLWRRWKEFKG